MPNYARGLSFSVECATPKGRVLGSHDHKIISFVRSVCLGQDATAYIMSVITIGCRLLLYEPLWVMECFVNAGPNIHEALATLRC